MKRILYLLLAISVVFALSACGPAPERATQTGNQGSTSQPSPPAESTTETPSPTPPAEAELAYEITYSNAYAWVNSIGTIWVQIIVEVKNTGTVPLYLSTGALDLEDSSGALVRSISMVSAYPDVIDPGEKGWYYEETTLDIDEVIDLVVLPRPDIRRARIDNIRFNVTDVSLSDAQFGGIRMMGRVENTHDEEHSMTYVVAILYDGNDIPIARLFTIIMEPFAPGDRIGFEGSSMSLPRDMTTNDVARFEAFAYPMQMQFN